MKGSRLRVLLAMSIALSVGCGEPDLQETPRVCSEQQAQECDISDQERIQISTAEELERLCDRACGHVQRMAFFDLRELSELSGFSWLTRVEVSLNFLGLRSVRAIRGFDNLEYAGSIVMEDNEQLETVDAFHNLKEVLHINLRSIHGMEDLRIFESLEFLGPADNPGDSFGLFLRRMNGLKNLQGLNSVREAGYVVLHYNQELESLEGMDSVEEIRSLSLEGNPKLASLGDWPSLRRVHLGVGIRDTPNLRLCEVEAWLDQLEERPAPENISLVGLSDAPCD